MDNEMMFHIQIITKLKRLINVHYKLLKPVKKDKIETRTTLIYLSLKRYKHEKFTN